MCIRDSLDTQGLLVRTHGGAVRKNDNTSSFEWQHNEKLTIMLHEKKQIAKLAASFVHEGDTILLDSGTTTYYLASELSDIPNLTVITYDLFIGGNLALHPTSTMIVTGGIRRQGYNNCLLYTSSGRRSGEQNYRGEEQSAGRYGIWTELH